MLKTPGKTGENGTEKERTQKYKKEKLVKDLTNIINNEKIQLVLENPDEIKLIN
jgi:hypothetical protein